MLDAPAPETAEDIRFEANLANWLKLRLTASKVSDASGRERRERTPQETIHRPTAIATSKRISPGRRPKSNFRRTRNVLKVSTPGPRSP